MENSNNSSKVPTLPSGGGGNKPSFADEVDKASIDQRHLREFNEWLARWINYQGLLAKYWKTRAQYEQRAVAGQGDGQPAETGKSLGRWDVRFQELCEYKVSPSW